MRFYGEFLVESTRIFSFSVTLSCLVWSSDHQVAVVPHGDGFPTTLSWKNGVPVLNTSRLEDEHLKGFRKENTPMIWRSGTRIIELDPAALTLRFPDSMMVLSIERLLARQSVKQPGNYSDNTDDISVGRGVE